MKTSRFFAELNSVYQAEIEDLKSDSEGKNVLKARLREKRQQLPMLLPMMASNPEMLATAFHEAFRFMNPMQMETLLSKEERNLPEWASLNKAIMLEAWAEPLAKIVLAEADGSRFLVIAAALEYLLRSPAKAAVSQQDHDDDDDQDERDDGDDDEQNQRFGRDDGDDGDDYDLDEAGADWLAEQGFDRKD